QVGVDAAGQHDGQAAVDAQPAQVGNGRQLARQLAQPAVVENQRVAPAQNHFADVRARSDIVEGGGETAGGGVGLGVGKVPAEAVAAMNGAGAGDYQQHPAVVFVQHASGPHGLEVADRIDEIVLRRPQLV